MKGEGKLTTMPLFCGKENQGPKKWALDCKGLHTILHTTPHVSPAPILKDNFHLNQQAELVILWLDGKFECHSEH